MEKESFDTALRELTSKRSSFKGRLTKFKNTLEILSNSKSIPQVEISKLSIKLSRFEGLFTEFDELQTQIEILNVDSQEVELNIRDILEQDFCYCIATAQQLIADNSSPRKSSHSCCSNEDDRDRSLLGFKLPTIQITKFDGSYYKWLEFKDIFTSLVHDNNKIKDVHKFYYLNSYLEGEAARVISNLEVVDKNYVKAWQLLCERYDNKRQLINNHLKALFNIDTVRESEKSLRFIIDHISKNLRALHTLGLPTESWDMIIIFIVSQKLDATTALKWEECRSNIRDLPTLHDFFEFLRNRADVFETINKNKNIRRSSSADMPCSPKHKFQTSKSFATTSSSTKAIACSVCKGNHRVYECLAFKAKSIRDRLSLVSSLNLCRNCLRNNCNVEHCRLPGGCKICRQRHNTLIHVPESVDESSAPVETVSMSSLSSTELADPTFNIPSEPDMILGAELFWSIIGTEHHSLGEHRPTLRSSLLGWLIGGPIGIVPSVSKTSKTIHCNLACSDDDLSNQISKFWELEKVPSKPSYTEEERLCEQHFLETTSRHDNGQFRVRIPLRCNRDCLGNSYKLAEQRFFRLEKRFIKQPLLKKLYVEFMREYADLGHLSVYNEIPPDTAYYIPHLPVLKLDSESTKIRVVYDASARTTSGFSVNDLQMVGPNVQDSLFNILVRFRQYKYVLAADIEKMYRSIIVHESDRDLQLILWREHPTQSLQTLQLNTVTYGFASSSFLSTRCLWQCGQECAEARIADIIKSDFYVDDLLTGAQTEEDLIHVQQSVSGALAAGGFHLRKYRSNSTALLNSSLSNAQGDLSISNAASTLGISWTSSSDRLNFPIKFSDPGVITKRTILSCTFKVFDPLGLLSLCTIKPKIIIQRLWSETKLGWDDKVPLHIESEWRTFVKGFQNITNLSISRQVLIENPIRIEMHSFCDASELAYGCCIYLKSCNAKGEVQVRLLCAKSRVSPIKRQTIPRLELCGALLSSDLSNSVTQALRCRIDRHVYWTDSKVVLGWLQTSKSAKTFVANRVTAIQEVSDSSLWRYVPTTQNPADLVSRGVDPSNISPCPLWWHGPDFLLGSEESWPSQDHNKSMVELPELKVHMVEKSNDSFFNITNISRFTYLQRAYAWLLRFIHNSRNPNDKFTGPLQASECENSLRLLIKISQKESFQSELILLSNKEPLKPKSILSSLNPFIDVDGILRVGGRLVLSDFDYDKKHPILLQASSHLTKILFQYEHVRLMHAGPSHLLASIRNRFWPIGGRNLARNTTRSCIKCRRFRGETMTNIMGNLPKDRLTNSFPFSVVGTDFAGPFLITDRKGRGAKISKCYLCIFVCFTYKCVHLEAVSELSTKAYILSLRRMISRRGIPHILLSDQGRNYVGAAREITSFLTSKEYENSVVDFTSKLNIEFKFSPAYAPHFGGLWEAGIKSAKFHLNRVMGNAHLTFEELSSLFAQVEAILNSRPLCPLSSSPNDLQCLTPGHFLIGRPLSSLPGPSFAEVKESRLDRYQRLERARQHFWRRWSSEYVAELQQRVKWRTKCTNLKVDDLVLIKEPNAPPLCWQLGRVARLYPGSDGIPRVADVATAQGTIRRALNRLSLLPSDDSA
ncbi:uncharacterized protein LOC128198008 isoform X1 [Bicyclus anynana]|uniref:Uncharacterized protein LOC128198008 isoform X1 n=1 Tax=Bicyclus anynana TaxID=110368 RepID=A0ABM3LXL4_BICAN|nr:uncharacterized protein LOC128198008 isoform X1 [Bicyclus anynana]